MRRHLLFAIALSSLAACSDDEPAAKATGPTLADLQASLFTPSCSFEACHGGANPKNGLDLSSLEASARSLVGVKNAAGDATRVVPEAPDESFLVAVLEAPQAGVRQMPLGFVLPPATIERVRAWISSGAVKGDPGAVTGGADDVAVDPAELPTPEDLPPPPLADGFQMGIDVTAPAGSEVWKCKVQKLPTTGATAINRVEALQTRGVHHMDVMALGLLNLPIEEGLYDCADLYDTYSELMEEGIFLFATQNEREDLQLPENVAALVPGALTVMVEIHYVNPTPRPVEVWSRVNAFSIPVADAKAQIWGSAIRDTDINVPPRTERHIEWTRCEMNRDIDLIILSSHTHQLAEYVDVYAWDGAQRGELLYENADWHAPQLLQFDPPRPVRAGQGFEFRCHYRNASDAAVHWGFGADDEMCQIAIVHTPFNLAAECKVVDSGSGDLPP